MRTNKNDKLMRDVFEHYNLVNSPTSEDKKRIEKAQNKIYKKVLKTTGKLTIGVMIYLILRNIIGLIKTKVILSLLLLVSIGVGTYFFFFEFNETEVPINKADNVIPATKIEKPINIKKESNKEVMLKTEYLLGIEYFKNVNIEKDYAASIYKQINNEFKNAGIDFQFINQKHKYRYFLFGSMIKTQDKYKITYWLVDNVTTDILFHKRYITKNISDVNTLTSEILLNVKNKM